MRRVRLIHWHAGEAKERAARLRAAGFAVSGDVPTGPGLLRALRRDRPAAIVIDLGRLPAQGRDVGVGLRHARATRTIPLVFVDGEPDKVARVRALLPDAAYTSWSRIRTALERAIARPPADPVAPASLFAGYAGVPLATKLGIKAGTVAALVGAPAGFAGTVGPLPPGASLRTGTRGRADLTLWFVRARRDLQAGIRTMVARAGDGPIWIAWPKQTPCSTSDLTQPQVRDVGLAAGLVDYKICAIDATWSGLLFRRRAKP